MQRITVISDTHTKHKQLDGFLPGGDLLIHAGDLSSMGYNHEVRQFCKWFNDIDSYTHKIFIAGNHDFLFENKPDIASEIVNFYETITYLQDNFVTLDDVYDVLKVYGSPWQPEFMHWAFNLPRNGKELEKVWDDIPDDTDILITHGPPYGVGSLDLVIGRPTDRLGCELLNERILKIKPKIHIFGHIHSGNGYYFDGDTHFFNASVLDESYMHRYKPLTFDWDKETNKIKFI